MYTYNTIAGFPVGCRGRERKGRGGGERETERERERERRGERRKGERSYKKSYNMFYNPTSEITQCHFFPMLFIISEYVHPHSKRMNLSSTS
jgi:hypothetical protein